MDDSAVPPSCFLSCCDEAIVDASLDDGCDGPAGLPLLAWEASDDSLLDEALAWAMSRFTRFRGLIVCAVFGTKGHGGVHSLAVGPSYQSDGQRGRRVDIWFGIACTFVCLLLALRGVAAC